MIHPIHFCIRIVVIKTIILFIAFSVWAADPVGELVETIPDSLVSLDNGSCAIVVDKAEQQLYLYRYNSEYRQVHRLDCSTGEMEGPKDRSGDKKTPEGVYFFNQAFEKRYLSAVYGDRAYPMDYPNLMDRAQGRKGNSIWMHGTNKPIKPRNSNGCIVLDNRDINRLAPFIALNDTPIVVVDRIDFVPVGEKVPVKEKLVRFIDRWLRALYAGTYHDYLAFYDPGYLPDISWWTDWYRIRNRMNEKAALSVEIKTPKLLKFQDIYVALFDQVVRSSEQMSEAGRRKLFIAERNNRLVIVGDAYQQGQETGKGSGGEGNPLIMAYRGLQLFADAEEEIASLVDNWLKAWSSKDIESYGSYYASDFRSQGMNRSAWLKKKRRLSRKYDFIQVTQQGLTIEKGKKTSSASFVQTYQSSGYKVVGRKKLLLKREDGQWKIFREIWKKI